MARHGMAWHGNGWSTFGVYTTLTLSTLSLALYANMLIPIFDATHTWTFMNEWALLKTTMTIATTKWLKNIWISESTTDDDDEKRQHRYMIIVASSFYDHAIKRKVGKAPSVRLRRDRDKVRVRVRMWVEKTHTSIYEQKRKHINLILCRSLCNFFGDGPATLNWTPFSHICGICCVCVCVCFLILFRWTDFNVLAMNFRYKRWWARRIQHHSVVSS